MNEQTNIFTQASGKQEQVRKYQQVVIEKTVQSVIRQMETRGQASVLVSSPTGSGKTYMGLQICKRLQEIFSGDIGWVAHRTALLDQAVKENDTFTKLEGFYPVSMFSKEKQQFSIMVFDEAQHSTTESAVQVLAASNANIYIGLSATPYRADNAKLSFSETVSEANYRSLIKEGYLACFNHFLMDEYSPESVAAQYAASPEKWGQSIMFFLTIEECMKAADILQQHGVRTSIVTSDTKDVDAEIEAFHMKSTQVLLNVMILTEGFDCPSIQTVFCRDTASKAITIQIAGRGLRVYGNKVANIVQSKGTKQPFSKFADPKENWVWEENEQAWRQVFSDSERLEATFNEQIDEMRSNSQQIGPWLAKLEQYKQKQRKKRKHIVTDTVKDEKI